MTDAELARGDGLPEARIGSCIRWPPPMAPSTPSPADRVLLHSLPDMTPLLLPAMARTRRWPSLTIGRLRLSSSCGRGQSPVDVGAMWLRCGPFVAATPEKRGVTGPEDAAASGGLADADGGSARSAPDEDARPSAAASRYAHALRRHVGSHAPRPKPNLTRTDRGQAMDVCEVQILMPAVQQANFALERVNALSGLVEVGGSPPPRQQRR